MKFNIYNYDNEPTEVDKKAKEIKYITVEIVSGHEFICIHYENGIMEYYVSILPFIPIYDEDYIVPKERLQEWIDLEKNSTGAISYYRLKKFTGEKEK